MPDPTQISFGQINPSINVALPIAPGSTGAQDGAGVQFARPPLPDEQALRNCAQSNDSRETFYGCVLGHALPSEYRLTQQCLEAHSNDSGEALICSTGRQDLSAAYQKYKSVRNCVDNVGTNESQIAMCVGVTVLGQNENYYLGCLLRNQGQLGAAAVCALGRNLNPEQQIALSCAITTGGEPTSFATCTGGLLLERELDKCLQHGIGTDQGCFGPNNEYRKFLKTVDNQVRHVLGGEHTVAYQAYQLWQNNVLGRGLINAQPQPD